MTGENNDQSTSAQNSELPEPETPVSSELTSSSMPEQMGPWKIDRKIGSGGMGTVYLGIHEETSQQAAVKVLPASLAREEGFVARFRREIESMKQLENRHIVKFIDDGVQDETYYYTMEFVDGDTLTSVILREKRMAWEQVVDYSIQICSALKAAHDTGIVHRDLKPSNLLIDKNDQIKLTDFGVAQVFAAGKLTVTGGIIGTAEYMSPEQAQGTRASKKSDLYSLGAVMYAMICGRPPFSGRTTLEVIQKHKFGQFDRPNMYVPEMPLWLNDIICQLLEKDPDKRFPDAYVLSRRLQEKLHQHQLRTQELTLNATGNESLDATMNAGVIDPQDPNATLMRDLMRAQIEEATQKGPIGNILDNTIVLVLLLALVIMGGMYFTRGNSTQKPVDSNQESPLLVEEPQRLLKQADHFRDIGDYEQSRQILSSLEVLLTDEGKEAALKSKVQIRLKQLEHTDDDGESRETFLERSLTRAQQAVEHDDAETARRICQSILILYQDEPDAASTVQEATNLLESLGPSSVAE